MEQRKELRTVREAVDEFLLYLSSVRTLSDNTVTSYRNDYALFCAMDHIDESALISKITTEDLRLCVGILNRKKKLAIASVNRFISAVRSLFAYCKKFGYITTNPALEIKTIKKPRQIPRFMTGAEVDELCAAPEKHELLWAKRDKAIFEMFYSSGCRLSELASLKLSDFTAGYASAVVRGKGNKDRFVYFEEDARRALQEYLADREKRFGRIAVPFVFLNQNGSRLSARGISYIVSRYSGAEGTNHHVSPHAFRHTFATAMLTGGADVRVVQELLGHSSISTTQRYTHVSTQRLIDLYNSAHPHGGNKKS